MAGMMLTQSAECNHLRGARPTGRAVGPAHRRGWGGPIKIGLPADTATWNHPLGSVARENLIGRRDRIEL